MSLQEAAARLLPAVEAELKGIVESGNPHLKPYYQMMRYHLGWADGPSAKATAPGQARTGKRLRPLLCLLACEAVGGDWSQALAAACALELVHNYSLVHDDIQDRSLLRRGRPTVWSVWGVADAINVGDGLFVLAWSALHRLGQRGRSPAVQAAANAALEQACLALCEGQFLDMSYEHATGVTLEQYLDMIQLKTGSLLAASGRLGALAGGANEVFADAYGLFGENLGIAFQIQDDVLGIWGDPAVSGKSAASDLRDQKMTLPVLYTLAETEDEAAEELAELYALEPPLSDAAIAAALSILDRVGARQEAEVLAERFYRLALHSLDATRIDNAAQRDLRELAASLVARKA